MSCGLVFGPLAFGATQVWSLCVLQILAIAIAAAWLISGAAGHRGLWLPLAVAAVGFLQVLPLPRAGLELVSPVSSAAHATAEACGPEPYACVSVHPGATRQAARQALLLALLVVATRGVACDQRLRGSMAWTAVAVGVLVLLIGNVPLPRCGPLLGFHNMRGLTGAYMSPLLPLLHSAGFGCPTQVHVGEVAYEVVEWYTGDTFGPYVVSNHFAGCLDLTVPLGVALLWGAAWRLRSGHIARIVLPCGLASLALFAVSVGARSWAGTAALLAGLLCVAWGLAPQGWYRTTLGVVLAAFAAAWLTLFVALCAGGKARAIGPSWLPQAAHHALGELRMSAQGRMRTYGIAAAMFRSAPLLGVGLGTFADVHPTFSDRSEVWGLAHNDYLQLAAETGLAGFAVAAIALAWAVASRRRQSAGDHRSGNRRPEADPRRRAASACATADLAVRVAAQTESGEGADAVAWPEARQMAAGLQGSLLAFAVHGLFDWNLHVPANAWIFAVLAGLWLATPSRPASLTAPARAPLRLVLARAAALCATVALLGLAATATLRQLAVDSAIQPLRYAVVAQGGSTLKEAAKRCLIEDALPAALGAARSDPWNADHAEVIARAYLHLSRGRPSAELSLADRWFCRALALCPVRRHLISTLQQIRATGS